MAKVIKPFLFKNGRNIALIQIENELGSLNSDSEHTTSLISMWIALGIDCEWYIEDAARNWRKHYQSGLHVGLSGGEELQ